MTRYLGLVVWSVITACSTTSPSPSLVPLTTATIELREAAGPTGVGTAIQRPPELSARVCVQCPACPPGDPLMLSYRGAPARPASASRRICDPGSIELTAPIDDGDPTNPTVEISDPMSSIVMTLPADALAARTLTSPDPGEPGAFSLCPGQTRTFQWSPASDLPAAPLTGDLSFVRPFTCSEGCVGLFLSFNAEITADPSGVTVVVPTLHPPEHAVSGGLTVFLPQDDPAPRPALGCDGGAACSYQPFAIAQHGAVYNSPCP